MPELLLTHGYFMFEDPKELQISSRMRPWAFCTCARISASKASMWMCSTRRSAPAIRSFTTYQRNPFGAWGLRQPDDTPQRRTFYQSLPGGMEDHRRRPRTGRLRSGIPGAGANVVVFGEGEITMQEVLEAFRAGDSCALAKVAGIAFLDDAGVMKATAPRSQIRDLDAQPWPARDAIDIPRYVQTWKNAHGKGSVSFITARGCPYKCRWCSHQVFGTTHRRRNPILVVDEVEWLLQRYSPDMAWVADDVFTIHHGWIRDYAAEMKHRGLRVPFECISR